MASQMANAVYDSVSVEVEAAGHSFRASSSSLKFSGYTAVYEEGKDDEKEEKESPLPALREGEALTLKDFGREQHFTQPPAHYTDATLIRAMEEQGIGRPSTYAPHGLHHPGPGVRGEGGQVPPHHQPGPGGDGADEGAVLRHRGPEVHRPHGAASGLRGGGADRLEGRAAGVLRRFRPGPGARGEGPGRHPHQGARRDQRGDLPRVRKEPGGQVRPVSAASWPARGIRSAPSPCPWWWRCRAAVPSAAAG